MRPWAWPWKNWKRDAVRSLVFPGRVRGLVYRPGPRIQRRKMIQFVATWTGEAFAVVRLGPTGATIVQEGSSAEAMQREADKLNAAEQAREAAPVRRPAYYGQRRSVRYFEPDAFA